MILLIRLPRCALAYGCTRAANQDTWMHLARARHDMVVKLIRPGHKILNLGIIA